MSYPARALVRALCDGRWADLLDVAEAQFALLRAQFSLWTTPNGALAHPAPLSAGPISSVSEREKAIAERLARAVGRAARLGTFRPRCLARAIALSRLLTAHGIDGHHIRIGVRREDGAFVAHAWVELGDLVLGETRARTRTFVPLTDLRSAGARFSA